MQLYEVLMLECSGSYSYSILSKSLKKQINQQYQMPCMYVGTLKSRYNGLKWVGVCLPKVPYIKKLGFLTAYLFVLLNMPMV